MNSQPIASKCLLLLPKAMELQVRLSRSQQTKTVSSQGLIVKTENLEVARHSRSSAIEGIAWCVVSFAAVLCTRHATRALSFSPWWGKERGFCVTSQNDGCEGDYVCEAAANSDSDRKTTTI